MHKKIVVLLLGLFLVVSVEAKEIKGVEIQNTVTSHSGKTLVLNGAGVRSKFFFSIYVAALYVEHASSDAEELIKQAGEKKLLMHFVYDEVDKDKLNSGWVEGFNKNLDAAKLSSLKQDINKFTTFFGDMKKDDTIWLNQLASGATSIVINNKIAGEIANPVFYPALLSIWLGKDPVTDDLKEALLTER